MKVQPSKMFIIISGVLSIVVISYTACTTKRDETVMSKQAEQNKRLSLPDTSAIAKTEEGNLVRYGRDLIVNTSIYLGPKGRIAHLTNGMNCGNCHINGGERPFGNSFAAVASTYPKYRERSGKVESVEYRINECMERSLDGKPLDTVSKEMKAMVAYIKWVGHKIQKGTKPTESGTEELPFLARPADSARGSIIYIKNCQNCHGQHGEGTLAPGPAYYVFPPLWGPHSYNVSAGMYRLSKLAGFIKNNMPLGVTRQKPGLSTEDAWDVAAFINSQPHHIKFFKYDWPKISSKPVDYPFGPYNDTFSETQHKYGPFKTIKEDKEKKSDSFVHKQK